MILEKYQEDDQISRQLGREDTGKVFKIASSDLKSYSGGAALLNTKLKKY